MTDCYTFTSESVSEGHPDKMADLVSDKILDAVIKLDPNAKVACETFIKTGMVIVGGEISTCAEVDIEAIVRSTINEIGYQSSEMGFDGNTCAVINVIGKQSPDIVLGLTETSGHEQGAGDQGLMFGYATKETEVLMPAPIFYAHALMQKQAELRKNRTLPWLRPDAKSQVSLRYREDQVIGLEALVLSTQHAPNVDLKLIREAVIELIVKPVIPSKWIDKKTVFHINPTGKFVIGGPLGDCGLTGRKIIVDSYGGMARHGGGAFSGKDPSKVDRSGAYMCRYIAKNCIAAGLASKIEIQVSYAIGVAKPVSIFVETFGTGRIQDASIVKLIQAHFDLKPKGIIGTLQLKRPIYSLTTNYGHFGRKHPSFTWELLNKVNVLNLANN